MATEEDPDQRRREWAIEQAKYFLPGGLLAQGSSEQRAAKVLVLAQKIEKYVTEGTLDAEEHYDEETLFKVYEALEDEGLSRDQAAACVSRMQHAGILFRERA